MGLVPPNLRSGLYLTRVDKGGVCPPNLRSGLYLTRVDKGLIQQLSNKIITVDKIYLVAVTVIRLLFLFL